MSNDDCEYGECSSQTGMSFYPGCDYLMTLKISNLLNFDHVYSLCDDNMDLFSSVHEAYLPISSFFLKPKMYTQQNLPSLTNCQDAQ